MIYLLLLIFIFGCFMGSFLTCQGERIASERDWVHGHSVCESCGHVLGAKDLVPVFSYLMSGGRCRYCKASIPASALYGELFCGYLYARIFSVYGFSVECAEFIVLVSLLYSLSIVDYRIFEIPDGFIIAGCFVRIAGEFIEKGLDMVWIREDLAGALAVPLVLLVISLIMDRILGKESLGGGDVKLLFIDCGNGVSVNE